MRVSIIILNLMQKCGLTEIMAEKQNPRWRLSAISDYRTPNFWTMGPLGLAIFPPCTRFGAKMLIDAEIMAQNRNPRWQSSAILELMDHVSCSWRTYGISW